MRHANIAINKGLIIKENLKTSMLYLLIGKMEIHTHKKKVTQECNVISYKILPP